MVPNQNAVADMGKTKQNKTRPLIGCTYRYDFNTLKPHARQRERGKLMCKSCSSRRTDCSFFCVSQTDKTDVTKALHLNSPRLKETRWAVQSLAGSKCRRRRTRDKEDQVYMQSEVKLVSQMGRRGSDARHRVWNLQDSPLENRSFSFGVYSKADRLLHRAVGNRSLWCGHWQSLPRGPSRPLPSL